MEEQAKKWFSRPQTSKRLIKTYCKKKDLKIRNDPENEPFNMWYNK